MLRLESSLLLIVLIFSILYGISYLYTREFGVREDLMNNYMGFIYILFGVLKLYDLSKFVKIFSKYDIIAKNVLWYGYLYPFMEIILGLALLKRYHVSTTLKTTIILMVLSIASVLWSLINGEKLRCGCLGSFFHIPLSYVTLSENVLMLVMAFKGLYM